MEFRFWSRASFLDGALVIGLVRLHDGLAALDLLTTGFLALGLALALLGHFHLGQLGGAGLLLLGRWEGLRGVEGMGQMRGEASVVGEHDDLQELSFLGLVVFLQETLVLLEKKSAGLQSGFLPGICIILTAYDSSTSSL